MYSFDFVVVCLFHYPSVVLREARSKITQCILSLSASLSLLSLSVLESKG